MYREMILNSEDFFRGDKNRPVFIFPEDVKLKKFCVRNVQLPNFFVNLPADETLVIETRVANGDITSFPSQWAPTNFLTLAEFNTRMNTHLASLPGPPTFQVEDTFFLTLQNTFDPTVIDFRFNYRQSGVISKYMRRLLGDCSNVETSQWYLASGFKIGALKMSQNNYVLLKSDSMSGATFTPNLKRSGSYSSASVMAKIPTRFSEAPYGTYLFYNVNDSPSSETMFSYNGGKMNMFDLYFTRPNDTDVIDFQGWNFSVTIGIITDRVP